MECKHSSESPSSELSETTDIEDEEEEEERVEEEEEVTPDEQKAELSMAPSEPEKLFVEAVQKLSSYEHSLETLVKRFDKDGIPTDSEIAHSEGGQRLRNSGPFSDVIPGGTDRSAGGDNSMSRMEHQTLDYRKQCVNFQIPFRTAEVILRILNEDLGNRQGSALEEAEYFLSKARDSIVIVKELLQNHLEEADRSQKPILIQSNEIAEDMLTITDRLREKLVEYQVQNLSELLVKSMKDETRLTMLAKKPRTSKDEGIISKMALTGGEFYSLIFCFAAFYFIIRLVSLYLEREKVAIDKAFFSICQHFQEDMKQLFEYMGNITNLNG